MTYEKLALLRSLAMRPSSNVAPTLQAMAHELLEAGYIARGPDGWIATAEGCKLVERQRPQWRGPGGAV